MEPKRSVLCSQEPADGSYSEPDESSAKFPTLFPTRSILIFSSLLSLSLPRSLPSRFSDQNFVYIFHLSLVRATCLAHLFVVDFITLIILLKSTSYEAPHYVVFSSLPPLPPS
jgi:hypothetical protein